MNKIIVSLHVPSINEKYDIFVPDFLDVQTISGLLARSISDLSEGQYMSSGKEILCSIDKRIVLSNCKTLAEQKIQNGEKLMLC